jgi:hypothetical protein
MSKAFTRSNRAASSQALGSKHRSILSVELVTSAALALSTAVAVTAVSIGMARADVIGAVTHGDKASLAIAVFMALLFSGMGGLTALMARGQRPVRLSPRAYSRLTAGVGWGCHRRTSWDVRR